MIIFVRDSQLVGFSTSVVDLVVIYFYKKTIFVKDGQLVRFSLSFSSNLLKCLQFYYALLITLSHRSIRFIHVVFRLKLFIQFVSLKSSKVNRFYIF